MIEKVKANALFQVSCGSYMAVPSREQVLELLDALTTNTSVRSLTLWSVLLNDKELQVVRSTLHVNSRIKSLNLVNNAVQHNSHLGVVADIVAENKSLEHLSLERNSTCCFCSVFDALKLNHTLRTLDLTHCLLGYTCNQCVVHLSDALKVNSSLKSLTLSFDPIQIKGAEVLAEALKVNRTLTNISLRGASLGEGGVRFIAEALKVNRHLALVDLGRNEIPPQEAPLLAEVIRANHTIKLLDLAHNEFGDAGIDMLASAMENNGSLEFCGLNNDAANQYCLRNEKMHAKAKQAAMCLIAIRRFGRTSFLVKELFVMMGMYLWKSKCDIQAWGK